MKNNLIILITFLLIPFYLLFQPQSEASEMKNLKIHLRGLGSINLNDRIDQIEKKLSIKFVGGKEDSDFDGKPCYFYSIPDLKSVSFMFTGAANDIRLGRIYINDPSLETISGIKIGSDVQSVLSKYKDNIQRSSEHYTGNLMLVFVPKDNADKNFRILFFTDNKKVTEISVGKIPEIFAGEGCS